MRKLDVEIICDGRCRLNSDHEASARASCFHLSCFFHPFSLVLNIFTVVLLCTCWFLKIYFFLTYILCSYWKFQSFSLSLSGITLTLTGTLLLWVWDLAAAAPHPFPGLGGPVCRVPSRVSVSTDVNWHPILKWIRLNYSVCYFSVSVGWWCLVVTETWSRDPSQLAAESPLDEGEGEEEVRCASRIISSEYWVKILPLLVKKCARKKVLLL